MRASGLRPCAWGIPVTVLVSASLALLLGASPAGADEPRTPRVGDCFDLPGEALAVSGVWLEASPVSCTRPHTFEVTRVDRVPAEGDPFASAAPSCSVLAVGNEVGVNRPVAGVVRAPLSVEARYVGMRDPEPVVLCGAVAVSFDVQGEAQPRRVTRPISELSPRARSLLQYCLAEPPDRGRDAVAASVPCTDRPRWQVDSWIVWTAFYDEYPGRGELRERAQQLCAPGSRFAVPGRVLWESGTPTTWCLSFYP
jgi:hypothetical protein